MRIPGLFRQYKPREFKYMPRYYNQEKEEFEERVRRIQTELDIEDNEASLMADNQDADETRGEESTYRSRIQRGSFTPRFKQKEDRLNRYTPVRLVIIIMVLFLIAWYLLR